MAKKLKFRLTPAGILFLIAIGVLVIALIAVIAVLGSTCGAEKDARSNVATVAPSTEPSATPEATEEPEATDEPTVEPTGIAGLTGIETPDPDATASTEQTGGNVVVTTPNVETTTAPNATPKIYTSPTSAQKKAAKDGYVSKDKVKMRKGPATTYDIVKQDIAKNTSVTLYELQDGWWFLKCGSSYGYIRKDMIKEGKAEATAKPSDDSTYEGTIKTNSVAALRKEASKSAKAIKELSNGDKVTVYYKTKDSSGNTWYYVSDGKNKGYVYGSLISTSKKVPSK